MPRIRKVEIRHFRSIREFTWCPAAGINCLIGPGDSGKSTILDAIDFCLGARRNIQFTDADFHRLGVESPISIAVTLGELDDTLKSLDTYGLYVRGFDAASGRIEDEPERDAETVLTVSLTVASDLEPSWSLVSERAEVQGLARNLNWSDRVRLAPTRIGVIADFHLGWRRGSVLNRVSDERADASAALAKALVDCGGGNADRPFKRASAFRALGYRAAIVRDDDKKPDVNVESAFIAGGGKVIAWRDGRALEDEMFLSLTDKAVERLIDRAVALHGEELVDENIKSASLNAKDLDTIRAEALIDGIDMESRRVLGRAARTRKAGWFKSITWMEDIAREIVGPDLDNADKGFTALVADILAWAGNGRGKH